ncbi:hypothetical protein H2200_006044 [Cladophialophora chaetospira]|uniref:AA1-like domain-containing protein n=1 Tax=Cladophialophora chaetospira TaxID=386627 RepID=A0AA38XAC1_9EURO|nr:hypothetical protein H2200_006044 [Cladophialophora chaetospira]
MKLTLATLLLAGTSTISAAAIAERQTSCPAAGTSSSLYRVQDMTVTTKSSGKVSDIKFSIAKSATGKVDVVCKPDTGLIGGFSGGKRFECDGLGNGKYEFAYYGGTSNALWLRYDGLLHSKIAGTAAIALNCNGNTCTNKCPVYISMLTEDPDD